MQFTKMIVEPNQLPASPMLFLPENNAAANSL